MITAEHLSRSFSGNGLKLRDLNFHIEKGDCVGLIGPNGSGKRSLIRLILGIYNPDHGRLWVMGKNLPYTAADEPYRPEPYDVHSSRIFT